MHFSRASSGRESFLRGDFTRLFIRYSLTNDPLRTTLAAGLNKVFVIPAAYDIGFTRGERL